MKWSSISCGVCALRQFVVASLQLPVKKPVVTMPTCRFTFGGSLSNMASTNAGHCVASFGCGWCMEGESSIKNSMSTNWQLADPAPSVAIPPAPPNAPRPPAPPADDPPFAEAPPDPNCPEPPEPPAEQASPTSIEPI